MQKEANMGRAASSREEGGSARTVLREEGQGIGRVE